MLRRTRTLLGGAAFAALATATTALPAHAATAPTAAAPRTGSVQYVSLTRAGTTDVVYAETRSGACTTCLSLTRLTDDGRHETVVAAPRGGRTPPGEEAIPQLVFANARAGLSFQADVLRTTTLAHTLDGGVSWVDVSPTLHGLSVLAAAATPTTYVLVAAKCAPSGEHCTGARLLTSPVAPLGWSTTPLGDAAGLGSFGASVAAWGANVWIDEATTQGAPRLAVSHDGGRTFTVHAAPALGAVDTCTITATSAASLWAHCPTGMLASYEHSTDGGSAWRSINVGLSSNTSGSGFDPVTGDLAYFATGAPSHRLDRITGPTSRVTDVHHLPIATLSGLTFTDELDGLAAGWAVEGSNVATLARTDDGGRTWVAIALP